MGRFATILFSAFYLLTTVGVGINFHYCLGELSYVDVMVLQGKCCCGDTEIAAPCCNDESYFFQLDTEQQTSPGFRLIDPPPALLVFNETSLSKTVQPGKILFPLFLDLPPPPRPLWLWNCSLTYYG